MMTPHTPDGDEGISWESVHVCPNCGHIINLAELDLRAITTHTKKRGFQRLLDMPGYDVAALVEKSGNSASHIYAHLSLLQLIPTIAEAFTQELITAWFARADLYQL